MTERIQKQAEEKYPYLDAEVMTNTLKIHIDAKREAFCEGAQFESERYKEAIECLDQIVASMALERAERFDILEKAKSVLNKLNENQ